MSETHAGEHTAPNSSEPPQAWPGAVGLWSLSVCNRKGCALRTALQRATQESAGCLRGLNHSHLSTHTGLVTGLDSLCNCNISSSLVAPPLVHPSQDPVSVRET